MNRKPNILFFFTDMQRFDTIHALGNSVIRTPNLDRLVNEGTAFSAAYSPSPVCVPARCSMHYGRYPARTGVADNVAMPPDQGDSLPAALHTLGYHTASIGKCHFAPDKLARRGFDSRLIQEECCSDPDVDDYCRFLAERGASCDEPQGTRGEMYYIPQVSLHPAEEHPTQWIGDRTLDFLYERRGKEEPWFLFSSFIHPHPPFAPPKPWHKLYRSPSMPLPEVPADAESLLSWVNRVQNRYKYRDQGIDNQLVRNIKAYYYATISFVDYQIGRVLDELERNGELDDTLILFASDHGEYLGDYNCFGKRGMHDASARIPLLARNPERFQPGARCETAVSLVDIFPTLVRAAGSDTTKFDLDGEDLVLIARGESKRKTVFSQFSTGPTAIYMAVDAELKYVWSGADNREFLFDRVRDPHETRNRAGLAAYAEGKAALKQSLLEFLKKTGVESAYTEENGRLDWRKQPPFDAAYLRDPDAGLLFQDHEKEPPEFPSGYTPLRA